MSSNAQAAGSGARTLHPAAYFLVASGGGVVGTDYATWLSMNPVLGAIAGGAVSLVILRIAYACSDPDGSIRSGFGKLGAFVGAVLGAYIAYGNTQEGISLLTGGGLGGLIGYGMGRMAAAMICLAGVAVLLLSQGPVGLAVRTFILNMN